MPSDPLFNCLALGLTAAVGWLAPRQRRGGVAALTVAGWLVALLVLAAIFQQGLFHLARLSCSIVFLHTPLLLTCAGAATWSRQRGLALATFGAAATLALGGAHAFFVEPYRLELSAVEVVSSKITRPITIAVLADFQADHVGDYERRALKAVAELEADLLLLPGDYIQQPDPERRREEVERFRQALRDLDLRAPLGVFAVQGNVDGDRWQEIFDGLPVTAISASRSLELEELTVTGLSFADSFSRTLRIPPSGRFHVVFGHGPDFALGAVEADLLVAGHTHGGQVRVPGFGPIFTLSAVPRAWAAGVTALPHGGHLVVSRGVGMERGLAPRLRLFCRPEIVLITVVPVS